MGMPTRQNLVITVIVGLLLFLVVLWYTPISQECRTVYSPTVYGVVRPLA
jgi:ABC-type transporter Mla subunit MlaD